MNEKITTQFKLTDEYWSNALRVLYRYKRPFRYHQRWIGVAVLLVGVALWFVLGSHRFLPIALVVVGVIEMVEPSITRWRFMRDFRSNPGRGGTITVEFGQEAYRMETPNSQGEMKYSAPLEVIQTPAGILIFPQKRLHFFIPVDAFARQEEMSLVTRRFQDAEVKTKIIEPAPGHVR